jgi:hypothetical protein
MPADIFLLVDLGIELVDYLNCELIGPNRWGELFQR